MDLSVLGRIVSLLAGAVTLVALHYGLLLPLYVALPAGLIAYTAGRLAFALAAASKGPR